MKEYVKNLDLREKVMIIVFLVLFVSGIYYNYFYIPVKNEIAKLNKEKIHLQENIQLLYNLPEYIPILKNNYQLLKNEVNKIKNDKNNKMIISEIKNVIVSNELNLKKYNTKYNDDKLYLEINVLGEYESTKMLLNKLDKWKKRLNFKKLEINSDQNQKIELEILLYLKNINSENKKNISGFNDNNIIENSHQKYLNIENLIQNDKPAQPGKKQEIYIYNKNINNPFYIKINKDQVNKEFSKVKSEISFNLKGILKSKDLKLALIKTANSVKIFKTGDKVDRYLINNIFEDKIIIKDSNYLLEIGLKGVENIKKLN